MINKKIQMSSKGRKWWRYTMAELSTLSENEKNESKDIMVLLV